MPPIRPRRSFFARLSGGLAALAFAGACLSPTLPLPPPDAPDTLSKTADGTWQVRGTCIEGAEVSVLNEATGRGVIYVDQSQSGRYVVVITGNDCDVITVSQKKGEDTSSTTATVLTPTENGLVTDPSICGL